MAGDALIVLDAHETTVPLDVDAPEVPEVPLDVDAPEVPEVALDTETISVQVELLSAEDESYILK